MVTVGDYVLLKDGRTGRVLFVGNVHHIKRHEVLGVELSTQYEGDHDGSIDRMRYFQCSIGRGVFVGRFQVERILINKPEDIKTEEQQELGQMIDDLNLHEGESLDFVSFQMAVQNNKSINTTYEIMEKVWKKYENYQYLYHTPAEQLKKCFDLIKLEHISAQNELDSLGKYENVHSPISEDTLDTDTLDFSTEPKEEDNFYSKYEDFNIDDHLKKMSSLGSIKENERL
eukprot:UN31498